MAKTQKISRFEPAAPLHVAAYIRVSTDEQAKSGLGLGDQKHRTAAMATVKGWPEPVIYADEGISGTRDPERRAGLRQLMADVRAGNVDAVIVLDLSRIARKTLMVLNLVDELRVHNVSLVSCKESLDTTTAQGQFVLTLFAALAQLERDMIAERTKGALDELARSGRDKGGRPPYGYVRTEDGISINERQAQVVKEIFHFRKMGWALRQIAANLNTKDVATPRGGGIWFHTSVREILLNESAYRGGGSRGQEQLAWPQILPAKAA